MIEYRKHKSGRQFFKIDGSFVTIVLNKEERSYVERANNPMIVEDVTTDHSMYLDSTEQEFKEQYQLAMERIQKLQIV